MKNKTKDIVFYILLITTILILFALNLDDIIKHY
jgi:hypothetical protein